MAWITCLVLYYLGAVAAAIALADSFDWGKTRSSIAVILWPIFIALILLVGLTRWVGEKLKNMKEEW